MKKKLNKINKEDIIQEYIINNLSLKELSLKFNISITTCKRILKKFNIHKSAEKSLEKRKATNIKKYGVEFCLQNKTLLKKAEKTCKERYDNKNAMQNEVIKQKQIKTVIDKYGVSNVFSLNSTKKKIKNTCKQKYGVDNYAKTESFNKKVYHTKQVNNTFNSSAPEKVFKESLIKIFGAADIFTQYKTLCYPFDCDFYIKSLDIFIELNLHWTHGGHLFNKSSKEDINKVKTWQNKHTKYYDNAIKVWTIKDPLKFLIAKKNNLNYFVFYSLKEAYCWLNKYKKNSSDK